MRPADANAYLCCRGANMKAAGKDAGLPSPRFEKTPEENKVIEPNAHNTGKTDETVSKGTMIKYGITNVPVDCFHVDGFRYGNLSDAVAQAKRVAVRET